MTYCIDFFRKFKKEGNFCGLDKSQVSRLTAYMEIVEALIKQKIPEEQIYKNFPVQAARPLIVARGDAHTTGLNKVTAVLKEGKKIKTGDLESWINPTSPTESKPKKERIPYNGTPQPGDYADQEPVPPPAPLAASMKERYTQPENQPPSPEAAVRAQERQEAAVNQQVNNEVNIPPCKSGKPCPEGRNYLIRQPVLGNKCDFSGTLVCDITVCPVIQRQRAAEANGAMFVTGGQIKAMDTRVSTDIPRSSQNQPMALVIKFTAKQWAVLKQIVREGQADTLEEAVLFLIDEAGERMGGS